MDGVWEGVGDGNPRTLRQERPDGALVYRSKLRRAQSIIGSLFLALGIFLAGYAVQDMVRPGVRFESARPGNRRVVSGPCGALGIAAVVAGIGALALKGALSRETLTLDPRQGRWASRRWYALGGWLPVTERAGDLAALEALLVMREPAVRTSQPDYYAVEILTDGLGLTILSSWLRGDDARADAEKLAARLALEVVDVTDHANPAKKARWVQALKTGRLPPKSGAADSEDAPGSAGAP